MNDEIKEILDFLDDDNRERPFEISNHDLKILRDYITNLQQKYESSQITLANEWKKKLDLEEENKHLENQIAMLKQQNNSITTIGLDYKSIINKAVEFIETNPLIWKPNMELSKLIENPDLKDRLFYTADEWLNKLHTILKGDDEK